MEEVGEPAGTENEDGQRSYCGGSKGASEA
jgi:hypothetical protein